MDMHWPIAIRIVLLGTALMLAPAANADNALDEMVMSRIMPRFDKEARASMKNSGVRHLSTHWDRETRTLMAMGELDFLGSAELSHVAMHGNVSADPDSIKRSKVGEICRHPGVYFIRNFLEKHQVTIAFVFSEKSSLVDSLVVEISHEDLGSCA